MEFGPRALGARSILADPRPTDMRERVNRLVKKREEFRPFAPAVLEERARSYFQLDGRAPFMVQTCEVCSDEPLPAVTHVDGSARVQTVSRATNPRFWKLLDAFERRTGCPVLLNTSFNVRGEPIVCTPEDAVLCFAGTGLDALVMEDYVIPREALPQGLVRILSVAPSAAQTLVTNKAYTVV
jgi:carbamoyltransferase